MIDSLLVIWAGDERLIIQVGQNGRGTQDNCTVWVTRKITWLATTNHSMADIANVYSPNKLPPQPTPTVQTQHNGAICLYCLSCFNEQVISEAINLLTSWSLHVV